MKSPLSLSDCFAAQQKAECFFNRQKFIILLLNSLVFVEWGGNPVEMLAPPFVEGFFLDLPIDTIITVYAVLPDSRFSEISLLWHFCGYFVLGNVLNQLGHFLCYWGNFHCCNRTNIE